MKHYKVYLDYQYQNKFIGIFDDNQKLNKYQIVINGNTNPKPIFSTNNYKTSLILLMQAKTSYPTARIDKWCLIK